MQLRDFLLSSLKDLPGSRIFHIHVLVSSPRKSSSLFPHATVKNRTYVQDIFILLSEQLEEGKPRILVSAVEAALYHIPSTSSAIIYVSKVDSTGQTIRPSPTPALVTALLRYYVSPATRPLPAKHVWIHVFARAQKQYLFPNSSEHPNKHVLSDVQLCAWWKKILTAVARETLVPTPRMYYILPGFSELEARQALGELAISNAASSSSNAIPWTYGHPYSCKDIPSPFLQEGQDARYNLGHCIPWFDDDPKARFIDEIACTHQADIVKSPPRKKKRGHDEDDGDLGKAKSVAKIPGELALVTPDDFWERMSFRQECVAGAVTAFFVAIFPSEEVQQQPELLDSKPESAASYNIPQIGQVSYQLNKRVISTLLTGHDFSNSELAIEATKILEDGIKGLCDGLPTSSGLTAHENSSVARQATPEKEEKQAELPHTPPHPAKRPRLDEMSEISPNTLSEPVSTSETYNAHIYGSIHVQNAATGLISDKGTMTVPMKQEIGPVVTVLTARKKKKKE